MRDGFDPKKFFDGLGKGGMDFGFMGGRHDDCDHDCDRCGDKSSSSTVQEMYDRFMVKHEFKPGMRIRWKKDLMNKITPAEDEEAIVIEVLEEPIICTENSAGSAYYREPLDLIVGCKTQDSFAIFYFDSRRFEPCE